MESATPMRIYAFVEYYPNAYKAYYDAQFADLVRRGHDLTVFALGTFDGVLNDKVREYGLAERTRYIHGYELRTLPRFAMRIAREIVARPAARAKAAATVARGRGSAKSMLKAAARACTLPLEAPDLCMVHSHRTMMLLPWLRTLYPDTPITLHYYGGEPSEAGRLDRASVREAFAGADITFALTEYAREEAIERGADPHRTAVLPLGFDIKDYAPPRPRKYRVNGVLQLVSAGRLSEGKGHLHALEALTALKESEGPPVQYTIIGDGYLRSRLETHVRRRGLDDQVTFTGTLTNSEMLEHFGAADALLLPSVPTPTWVETQGAVIQEALLMEAIAVATRTGGVPESVPPALHRFTVEPGNSAALAQSIRMLAELPEHDFRELGRAGREWVIDRYDVATLNSRALRVATESA